MKKIILFFIAVFFIMPHTALAAVLLEHKGTDISAVEIGTKPLGERVKEYFPLFFRAGSRYGVDPNILAAICMQESSGINYRYRPDGTEMSSIGIMQIDKSLNEDFAAFGEKTTGIRWTPEDRMVPEKAINYAAHLISKYLIYYELDYAKTIQSYNFGMTVTNRIIAAKGEEWLSERENAVSYAEGWQSDTFGDPLYLEHVLRYYHDDIEYIGAKVMIDGKLINFDDCFPLVENGRVLTPVRGVLEKMGAKVSWNREKMQAEIARNGKTVVIPVGSSVIYCNGREFYTDVPAKISYDRIMLPLRVISDIFGFDISWDQASRTAAIQTN